MRVKMLLVAALSVLAVGPRSTHALGDPGAAFREAFAAGVAPGERDYVLERIVKEAPGSEWADDALWVLGEQARRQGNARRVVYCWQYLMAVQPDPRLEEFTRSLELYRTSMIPEAARYVRMAGMGYERSKGVAWQDGRRFVGAKPFNPVPMLVWDGIARSYERLGKPALALRSCRSALNRAPDRGQWRKAYEADVARLEGLVAEQGRGAPRRSAPASGVPNDATDPSTLK